MKWIADKLRRSFLPWALLWGALVPWGVVWYRHQIHADGIAYLALARQWAAGNAWEAISGVWSPLESWLLAPILAAGVPPLAAGRLAGALAGVLFLWALWRWGLRLHWPQAWRPWAMLGGIAFALHGAYFAITPDLLAAAATLHFLVTLGSPHFFHRRRTMLAAGAWAALAYFAKAYHAPFAGAMLLGAAAYGLWRARQGRLSVPGWRAPLVAGLVLAAVIVPWGIALSLKYNQLTISTAGAYNLHILHAHGGQQPFERIGLAPPPAEWMPTAWVAPEAYERLADSARSAAAASRPSGGWLKQWQDNLRIIAYYLWHRQLGLFLLLALPLLLFRSRRLRGLGLLAAAGLYWGGYALVQVEDRYLWAGWWLLAFAGLEGARRLQERDPHRLSLRWAAPLLLLLPGLWPAQEFVRWRNDDAEAAQQAAQLAAACPALPDAVPLVATLGPDWHRGLEMCYRLGWRHAGDLGEQPSLPSPRALRQAGVSHVLTANDSVFTSLTPVCERGRYRLLRVTAPAAAPPAGASPHRR